ncbi:MAG TPA: response regulator [Polyangiaceae bacterium]|jgi:putative nucleotidyltransferase with HDIG domain|nr:response regulator [Polyangiaceae bacterium]
MRRLLFVDDEKLVLDGLRNMLRPKQRHWEMTFVAGGPEAIEELGRREFDVVVSDMRMPRVDGAAVLKHVQATQPNAVRIVLTGHTETELALRTIPVAHQFLSKPCDAATLEGTIDRACSLQSILTDPALRSAVGAIGRLPSVPALYMKINESLEKPTTSLKDVALLIEQDMAVSAKILQVVNSGFFGLPKRVTNVHAAVTFIGINMLRRILLSVQAFSAFERPTVPGFSLEELQKHSHLTAVVASRMFKAKRESEDAFTGGILHDIGKLILATRPSGGEPRPGVRSPASITTSGPPDAAEVNGVTHAEVGAYLLGIWGLPYAVVEAVAYHHNPLAVRHKTFDVVDAVYVANILTQESPARDPSSPDSLDHAHLAHLGVEGMLPEWRQLVQSLRVAEPGT